MAMDTFSVSLIGIGILLLLLILGVHIGFGLMISGFVGILFILHDFESAIKLVVTSFYHKVTLPELVTCPLFILMGFLASGGGISQNIYKSLSLWLGRFRSGLGIATVLACTAFGTVCGSSLVTASVFAKISAPEMRRCGYEKKLAYGICSSAGAIGMLIPPSILAVVYGILSGESVGKLLMAGVAPGIMLAFVFSITITIIGKIRPAMGISATTIAPSVTWRDRIISLKNWWSVAIVAFVIFGGLYGGVFSPSEASAAAAFLLLVIYLAVMLLGKHRDRSIPRELVSMFTETAVTSAMIFLVMGSATVFAKFITMTGLTIRLSGFLAGAGIPDFLIVLIIVFLVLILGCFLDSISILCITIPVFNPIINAAGIDPIWYATVIIVAVEVGLITPPFGLNVFATKGVAEPDVQLEDIFSGVAPFFFGMVLVLVVILLFPPISTFFPSLVE
jgi:tripartite ATP-independent transporter DctM subunit